MKKMFHQQKLENEKRDQERGEEVRILALNPVKWLQTATSTNKLTTHSILKSVRNLFARRRGEFWMNSKAR